MAEFAARELGARSAAVLTERDDGYSEGLPQTFTNNFGALGGRVARQFYMPGDRDFTAPLTAIAQAMPTVLTLVLLPTVYSLMDDLSQFARRVVALARAMRTMERV